MGRSCFLAILLVSALLSLSLSQGFGRRIEMMRQDVRSYAYNPSSFEERREMQEFVTMDYQEPGANTNPRNGAFYNSPTGPPRP